MVKAAINSTGVISTSDSKKLFKSAISERMSQAPSLDELLGDTIAQANTLSGLKDFAEARGISTISLAKFQDSSQANYGLNMLRPGSSSTVQITEGSNSTGNKQGFLQDATALAITQGKNNLFDELKLPQVKFDNRDLGQVRQMLNQIDKELLNSIKRSQDSGINRDDLQRLRDLLNNPLFIDFLVNNPDGIRMLNEMLEAIKSDPFNLSKNGINFNPKDFEIFSKLESTSAKSMVKAALGEELNSSLESAVKNNNYNQILFEALSEQARFHPNVQSTINDKSLSETKKLSLVAKETADFVRNNMAVFGAIESKGKLSPGLSNTEAITIVFGQGSQARDSFTGENGLLNSLRGPANKNREFAYFDISDPNSAKLAQSLGVKLEAGSDFGAAVITQDGVKFLGGGLDKLANKGEVFQRELDRAVQGDEQNQWLNPAERFANNPQEHAVFDKLLKGQAQFLNTESNSKETKSSDAFANLYASLVLQKFKAGKDESLSDGLSTTQGSLASLAERIERRFNRSEKSGLKHDRNSFEDTLTKFSGLSKEKVSELRSALSGTGIKLDAMSTAVMLQAGITDASRIGEKERTIMKDYQTAQGMSGKNSYNWYQQKLKEYVEKGYLPEYVLKHKAAAEQIMNINSKDGSTDNMSAFNMIGSVATIAHILEHPETAYTKGEGFYARLSIADGKDHNGAFGMNSGNHYMRGNEEAAFSLLRFGQIGNISIYAGNGMTDKEFTARINRLMRTNDGDYQVGNRGTLSANNDNASVRGLGLKHMSEEGHGNEAGNYGVIGSMDSSDKWRFAAYAALVKGDIFSLNCVACSNLGGNKSYGHVVLNEMSKELGKHVRLFALGAEVPTPPSHDRATHLNGQIAPSLITNSDRIVVNQGQQETSAEDTLELSGYKRDEYNITRAVSDEETDEISNSTGNDTKAYFASSR